MQFLGRTGHISRAPDAREGVTATGANMGTDYGRVLTTGVGAFIPAAPRGRWQGELIFTVAKSERLSIHHLPWPVSYRTVTAIFTLQMKKQSLREVKPLTNITQLIHGGQDLNHGLLSAKPVSFTTRFAKPQMGPIISLYWLPRTKPYKA